MKNVIFLLGFFLATCVDFQELSAGHHLKTIDFSNSEHFPAGMYILRLRIDDIANSQKLIKF